MGKKLFNLLSEDIKALSRQVGYKIFYFNFKRVEPGNLFDFYRQIHYNTCIARFLIIQFPTHVFHKLVVVYF